jgi:hypothetical protein
MRQEIVSNENVQQDEIIDNPLQVVFETEGRLTSFERAEFKIEIFSE